MSMIHVAQRPSWQCVIDGEPWPCEIARKELVVAVSGDLSLHMGRVMIVAARELGLAHNPSRLYRRFLRWTSDERGPCLRCGRTEHAVLPGLPPRLFPCEFKPARDKSRPDRASGDGSHHVSAE